jgi:CMP-N,N'-diacetyllegionaminic acid synthase
VINKAKLLGIILARKNSQRLINKNLLKIQNKNLIEITALSAIKSKIFNSIILYTDINKNKITTDKNITKHITYLKRPKKFSDNKITSEKTLIKMFNTYKHLKYFKDLILLQPTSPMRTSYDIKKMYKIYRNKKIKSLISVVKVQKKKIDKNTFFKEKKFYKTNGLIYISNINSFIKKKYLYNKNSFLFKMSKKKSIDIDTRADLELAKKLLNSK